MDYRRKFLRFQEKNSAISKTEKKLVPEEKRDNSYIQKILQNSKKGPTTGNINLTAYNENLPGFRTNIRDILSSEENKQKAMNYVIQKRNEEKTGKKILIYNKNDGNQNNNSKIFNKNKVRFNINRDIDNTNKNINVDNSINNNKPTYSYFIERKNKPYISQRNINENDNIRDKYRLNNQNNNINNYTNKSTSRINENNYTGRKIMIKSQTNNTSLDKTSQYNNENNNYRKIKVLSNFKN
jgi:hypothetical protein